jgi:hypothetical protein
MNRRALFVAAATCFLSSSCTSSGPTVVNELTVPGTSGGFSFDIGAVDNGHYYLADRTNKALDVYDTNTLQLLAQIKGTGATAFAGQIGTNNAISGPDGVVVIPGTNTVYVGDVGSVKVVDVGSMTVVKSIALPPPGTGGATGFRADEGCYDPDDKLIMISHPEETNPSPFISFVSTTTQTQVATLALADSAGLEACVYDAATKSFLVNNDGTTANPNGELDVITAASVVAGTPAVSKSYGLGNCGPTGLDLGPGNDIVIGCDPSGAAGGAPAGTPIVTLIYDKTSGTKLATVPIGGTDQVAYDKVSNRYFISARRWQNGGVLIPAPAGGTLAVNPSFGIIDAGSRSLVTRLDAGNNDHSVAVDGALHRAFVPHTTGSSSSTPLFLTAGITVYSTD